MTERIVALQHAREAELTALGLPTGAAGMDAAADGDAQIAEQWSQRRATATRAKQDNNNGVLIRTRMEYNRKALAALQVSPAKTGCFYGPDSRVPGV